MSLDVFTIYISKVGWCGRGQAARQLPDLQLSSLSFDVVSDKEIPAGFPQIIQNPGMKVVEKGRNTVLVCEAGGDPNPTITWIKVGWRDWRGTGPISGQASVAQGQWLCTDVHVFRTRCRWCWVRAPAPGTSKGGGSPCCSKVN